MSLWDCIQRAIDSGDLEARRGREAQAMFAERLQAHASAGPGAEALAAEDVWVALRHRHIRRKRQVLMQADAQMRLVEQVAQYRNSDGQANAARAVRALVEWDQDATFQSVAGIQQALESSYLRDVSQLIAQHSRNIAGRVRDRAKLANIVRELYSEGTGDASAKTIAQAVRETLERARREYNAAGGEIGKLEGYDLPHHWDREKVAAVNKSVWAEQLHDAIDWARIVDRGTERPFSQSSRAARIAFLEKAHDGIRTGGWNRREPSGAQFGASLAKSRADHRILHFRSADDWMRTNDAFGTADPFAAVVNHLKSMARDTAQMRVLGPNPQSGLEFAVQTALKLAQDRPWVPTKPITVFGKGRRTHSTSEAEVRGIASQTRRMLDMISGAGNAAEMDLVANFLAGTRHFLVASQLGGAMLSAVSDVGFLGMAARHVGMDPKRVLTRHIATLAKPENRRQLARAGIIADSAASTGVSMARMFGEAYGPATMANLSEFVLRASGLTAWTDIARGVFKLEFYGLLAENAGRSWDRLDAPLRDLVFKARGITPDEWETIRTTPLHRDAAEPEASWLIPDDIRRRGDLDPDEALALSLKLGSAIQEQVEFAVPSASLRGRSAIQVGKPGTAGGELLNSALMYKNFTLSLMFNQLGRVLYKKVNGSRFGNVLMFGLVTTAAGALSLQVKEMARGRDPRDMTGGKFWKAALLQGGGLGIFGDFIYAAENRFGNSLAASAAGPVATAVESGVSLIGHIATALTSGDPKKVDKAQREAVRFADQFSGPTNLWYLAAAFDRLIWDGLTDWLDPDAGIARDRAERKRIRDYGNGSYWPPGSPLPTRWPDLTNIIGAAP